MSQRVLDVGQCDADHARISQLLTSNFEVELLRAYSGREAHQLARETTFSLILVNRLLDADGSAGLEVVRMLKSDPRTSAMPVMLVSNFADAQQEAVAAGCERGFGKAQLGEAKTVALLGKLLNVQPARTNES